MYRPNGRVLLFTDSPSFFMPFFGDQPIEYILLTSDKIRVMRGEIDFLHRMKIALLEEAFDLTDQNLLYIDSDTFFINDPTPLCEVVSEKNSFMHLREYRFDSLKHLKLPAGKPFHDFLELIEHTLFYGKDNVPISVTPYHYSWNAGAMLLHRAHRLLLGEVYRLTDQFFPRTQNHASEQYAFSIVLQNTTAIASCDSVIYHYWYRVKKQIIDAFTLERINRSWSLSSGDQKIKMTEQWVKMLPLFVDHHILSLRDNAIQSFHDDKFGEGYYWAFRSFFKDPFNFQFAKDIGYHTKRQLFQRFF